MEQHFILATTGHVDHGKSALVRALTDTDPDRLPEEKARGITIELGFAEFSLNSKHDPETQLRLGIIDVPGHEDFVKNMVSGVGCVNLGLIIVAADDGWMPQTEEHLQILNYMGVAEVIVVLNKIDLAPGDEDFLQEVIRDELQASPYADASIVATSTLTGQGISELKERLAEAFSQIPCPEDREKPRLSIDRTFSVKGHGTVVTGTLVDGRLETGQALVVQPSGSSSRIRALQSFGQDVTVAYPGSRVAVNLANVAVRRSGAAPHEGVGRGDVVTVDHVATASKVIDCLVEKSGRLLEKNGPAANPLKHGARIRLHHGSSNTPGRLFFIDRTELNAGETTGAQIRLERDVMVLAGDRFVVRDWSEMYTLAGGIVLDALGDARRFRRPEQRSFFEQCQSGDDRIEALIKATLSRDKGSAQGGLLVHSCYGKEQVDAAVKRLAVASLIVLKDSWVFDASFWNDQTTIAMKVIDEFHSERRELLGMSQTQLRAQLDEFWTGKEGFSVLVTALEQLGFESAGALLKRRDHQISMPPDLALAVDRIRAGLSTKLLEPPNRKQLVRDANDERAIRFMIDTGEVVEVAEDLVFSKPGFEQLTELVRQFLSKGSGATVSELRQHTGVSRRIILPILEHLDTVGVTQRDGDMRKLRATSD